MTHNLQDKIPYDVDEKAFLSEEPVQVTVTLDIQLGLWNWIRGKANYEDLTHECYVPR